METDEQKALELHPVGSFERSLIEKIVKNYTFSQDTVGKLATENFELKKAIKALANVL